MTGPVERPAGLPASSARPAGAPAGQAPLTADEELVEQLVPIAMQLTGCVRDYGPGEVQAVLDRVPGGRLDALAVVLAAMVDPDARPTELLAWTEEPVVSRRMEPPTQPRIRDTGAAFDEVAVERAMRGDRVHLRPVERAEVVRRLTAAGMSSRQIAVRLHTTPRTVARHRTANFRRTA